MSERLDPDRRSSRLKKFSAFSGAAPESRLIEAPKPLRLSSPFGKLKSIPSFRLARSRGVGEAFYISGAAIPSSLRDDPMSLIPPSPSGKVN